MTPNQSTDNLFKYSKFCPNQQVNSIWLHEALAEAMVATRTAVGIAQSQQRPQKIRFFRRQMSNMITKACQELDIPAQASRRTYTLEKWLQQRMKDFYPHQPGYQADAAASAFVRYQSQTPQLLPDALQYEQWAFVSLAAAGIYRNG